MENIKPNIVTASGEGYILEKTNYAGVKCILLQKIGEEEKFLLSNYKFTGGGRFEAGRHYADLNTSGQVVGIDLTPIRMVIENIIKAEGDAIESIPRQL